MNREAILLGDLFWRIYIAFWLIYGAGYVVVFASQPNYSFWQAVAIASGCVIPGAFWGYWVARYYRASLAEKSFAKLSMMPPVAFAILFTCVWMLSVLLLEAARLSWQAENWRWARWQWVEIHWQLFAGLAIFVAIVSGAHIEASVKRVVRAERLAIQAQQLLAQAERETLLTRFSPHFLLNTLHALMALVRSDVALAEQAIEQLGDMLRYVIRVSQAGKTLVRCSEELAFVQQYVGLERLRLGGRLQLRMDVSDDVLNALIPPLLIQPLLENGIKHGISQIASGGELQLHLSRASKGNSESELVIVVENNTLHELINEQNDLQRQGLKSGVGLELIRRRLDVQYGSNAIFTLAAIAPDRVRAEIRLPWTTQV